MQSFLGNSVSLNVQSFLGNSVSLNNSIYKEMCTRKQSKSINFSANYN